MVLSTERRFKISERQKLNYLDDWNNRNRGKKSVKQGERSSVPPIGSPTDRNNSGGERMRCTRYRYSLPWKGPG